MARSVPQIPVVLVSLVLWGSFAWGLPAEAPSTEGGAEDTAAEDTWRCGSCGAENVPAAKYCTECGAKRADKADVGPKDPWAGVRISDAYDYAKCPRCGDKNGVRAKACARCGNELPRPSGEYTYPPWVFVPGKGYYREGTVLEPGKKRKGMLIAGLVLIPGGLITTTVAASLHDRGAYESFSPYIIPAIGGLALAAIGGVLSIVALSTWKEPIYALGGEPYLPNNGLAYALRPADSDAAAFKIEVTLLSF